VLPGNPREQKSKESTGRTAARNRANQADRAGKATPAMAIAPPPTIPLPAIPKSRPIAIGFYINWDESSYASLQRNLDHLDWLIPQWVHIQDPDATAIHRH